MYNNLRKMKERKAADEDNFYVSGPRDLTNGHWGNERDRRIISASLVKGAYAFEQDRQKDRKGLAPPWSKHFGYEKIDELIDVDDGSIFAVIYKFEPQQQQLAFNNHHQCCCCCYPIQGKAPRRVIAFRGTMFKKATAKRDVRLDIKIILNLLHETSRFKIAKQAVEKIVKEVGASNVCLAGHSLGAAIAMLVGKTMGKQGYMLQGLFFNPPFVSLPIEWIKDEEIKSFIRLSKMHLTAAIAAIRGHHQLENAFVELADWVPYLFVNANDIVCSEYVGYFEYRKAMEQIGFGDTEKLAAQNSLMNCFFSKKEGTERSHFIPFGDAAINKKPPPGFCRSHGLKVWWRPDLELEHKTYQLSTSSSAGSAAQASSSRMASSQLPVSLGNFSDDQHIMLDGTNYQSWRAQFLQFFRVNDFLRFVDGSYPCPSGKCDNESWQRSDRLITECLLPTITEEVSSGIVDLSTSAAIWSYLAKLYAPPEPQLQSFKKDELSMDDFIQQAKSLMGQLADARTMSESELQLQLKVTILGGLGPEYNVFATSISSEPPGLDKLSLDEFYARLHYYELNID